jgi:signal transduction histidine kinase
MTVSTVSTASAGTPLDSRGAAARADERAWRRGVRALGLLVGGVALLATVNDLGGGLATALLFGGLALWVVELLATPPAAVEGPLLVAIGCCGAAVRAVATDSAGFLLAYFAAAAIGLRLAGRRGVVAIGAVLAAMALAVPASGADHVATSLTTDLLGVGFAFAVASATRNARAAHASARALVAELEESRAAQAEAATLAERSRLAREIHDILAHSLSGQVMSLEAARLLAARTEADPRVVSEIERAHELAKGGLAETRDAIHALRGDLAPGPDRLAGLVADARDAHGLDATLTVHGEARPVPADVGLTVYRTAQEALTNTAKHAGRGASSRLVLDWHDDRLVLTATDDGRSAATTAPLLPGAGYGLTGLRERAELAGGSLRTSTTGDGFCLELTLPLPRTRP